MKCCGPKSTLIVIISSVFICCLGIALQFLLPELIHNTIAKNLVVSKSSSIYEDWVKPPVTFYTKFYFFNYTNADEFAKNWKNGTKPKVEQLGPYVYRQIVREKDNVTFYGEDEVEFYLNKALEFVPEMSIGTEEDMLTFPNMVLRSAAYTLPKTQAGILKVTSLRPFLKQTIGELLFDGYVDEVFAVAEMFTGVQLQPENKFHLLKKNTTEGPIRLKTGHSNINEIGNVVKYGKKGILNYWPNGSSCREIKGGDGSNFPPRIPTDKKLPFFAGAFCRSIDLRFEKEVDHFGLAANRFLLDTNSLDNTNPEHDCFCQSEMNYCRGSGVFNLGACMDNTQIFLSLPHLLHTDFHIRNAIDGLTPDPDKHVFQWDIEKNTGIPVNVSVNMQINFGIVRMPWMEFIDTLPEIILPILWMNEGLCLNETMAELIKSKVHLALMVADFMPMAIFALGGIFGISGIIFSIYYMLKGNKVTDSNQVQPCKEKMFIKAFTY